MSYFHKYNELMASKVVMKNTADQIILCSAILFLAGKATENIRRIREVLNVVRHLNGLNAESLSLRQVILSFTTATKNTSCVSSFLL
jgi:hypothetical protein